MDNSLFPVIDREEPLSDRVAALLQELIVTKRLTPGEKLPPERELADRFGVSRTVVRESIRLLKAKGLVDVQQGSGAIITSIHPNHIYESISLFLKQVSENIDYSHMAELRQLIEIEIAGLAAIRATEEDIVRMEQEIQTMEDVRDLILVDIEKRHQFARADVNFHLSLAVATKNPLFPIIFSPLVDILVKQRYESIDVPGSYEQGMLYHKDILLAIKKHDPEAARIAMQDHLKKSQYIMDAITSKSTKGPN
jgi:GntR family transcriptional regulator, transcriptional repressor for pyruvate dehydrogenase complex